MNPTAEIIQQSFREVQDHICSFLSEIDGGRYREDAWSFEKGTGGGISRIWEDSQLLEKAGVNFSAIRGAALPAAAMANFHLPEGTAYLATGMSLVLHPRNPFLPTIHMNIRYFEAGDTWWFGGGVDLTPYYPRLRQVISFHRSLSEYCSSLGRNYTAMKETCDDYFFLKHRNETRGVGGLFFDRLQEDKRADLDFILGLGMLFPNLFRPFVAENGNSQYNDLQRDFQLHRRSRYAEFNLLYDRGTLFGLQSGGRVESILMSLPPVASWKYDWKPKPGSPEEELSHFYLKPQDWLGMDSLNS